MDISKYKKNKYWASIADNVVLPPKHRRAFLLDLMPKNAVCAEIGVLRGSFAGAILNETKPKKLHLIDPWRYDKDHTNKSWGSNIPSQEFMDTMHAFVMDKFSVQISSGVVQIHRAFSHEEAKYFIPEYFDWVYIDGNHSFEFVKRDLETYFPLIKQNGFIAGDDYTWKNHPVEKAVQKFLRESNMAKLIMVHKDQFLIKKLS